MFSSLAKSFAQLSDPRVRKVVWWSILLALGVFILLWIGFGFLLSWGGDSLAAWLQSLGWEGFLLRSVEWLAAAASVGALLIVSLLVFPGVVGILIPLYLDQVADAVEDRHYPGLPPARPQRLAEMLLDALRLVGATVALNLLALPFYLIFLFIPGLNLLLFYLLNGYLLGREYFELVAVRRLARSELKPAWKARKGRYLVAGALITFLLTIPLVNLIAPVVATAFMVHLFQNPSKA
ncbi:EI24 domain-containing protein [Limibacillus sp. MBR-115]|jgi:uncharacterized protein involved in cysteine biosynthesis|uniref:EI24 domain-containing protein n=1 Tax=Limibacillus sp. MBR-115 TaxID=3156465 RepID=UPI0033991B99